MAQGNSNDRLLSGLSVPADPDIGCRHQPGDRRQRAASAVAARLPAVPSDVGKLAPRLATEFTVVASDLRGCGDSSKPPAGPDNTEYSKRALALDQVETMRALGFKRFAVAGHDRGARVAHRLARDHPERIERMALLDIVPTP